MAVLEKSTDAIDMYLHHLPDRLTEDIKLKRVITDREELPEQRKRL